MYSFFDGLHEADPEKHRLGRTAAAKTVPFVEEHLKCLSSAGPAVANRGLRFLYEGDKGFSELDQAKKTGIEGQNGRLASEINFHGSQNVEGRRLASESKTDEHASDDVTRAA